MFYVMFQLYTHRQIMFRLMFQHQPVNIINNKKMNDQKVNGTKNLLTHSLFRLKFVQPRNS